MIKLIPFKKIQNAAAVNASAVVVINNNPEGVITMSIGGELMFKFKFFFA